VFARWFYLKLRIVCFGIRLEEYRPQCGPTPLGSLLFHFSSKAEKKKNSIFSARHIEEFTQELLLFLR
jgi:hypothetical protein